MNDDYKTITVADIVREVIDNPHRYPKGLFTKVLSGDFEGNYTHQKHMIQIDGIDMCLGYEMHEGMNM